MKIAACYCTFKRTENSEWEEGIAVTTAHGLSYVVTIVADNGESCENLKEDVWDYRLRWDYSMHPPQHSFV